MRVISHRGNTLGPNPTKENDPAYLQEAVDLGYDVEVDIWYHDGQLFTGHDGPSYLLDDKTFRNLVSRAWFHCKNVEALEYFDRHFLRPNFFWHQDDDYAMTSWGYVWTYPHMRPTSRSIAVLPEIFNANRDELDQFWGVCTDYCVEYDPSQPR